MTDESHNIDKIFTNFLDTNNENDNLKLILGAGNKNYFQMKDFDKVNGEYDIAITDMSFVIDNDINKPVALLMDFNNHDLLLTFCKLLEKRFSKIIVDYSTNKFLNWDTNILKLLHTLLNNEGKLYIDSTICQTNILQNENINLNKHYDYLFENGIYNVKFKEDKFYSVPLKQDYDLIKYTNVFVYPDFNDLLNHNLDLLKKVGFKCNIINGIYPLTQKSSLNKNIMYIEATKI